MSYSSQIRYGVSRRYEYPLPSRNHHGEVRHAWKDTPSPRGNAEDASSSIDHSQQRQDTHSAATDEGCMETEETRDTSHEEVSFKTTAELFTALESLPELVERSKREIKIMYQSAPTRVTRENAELKKNLEQLTKENQNLKSTSSTNQGDQVNKLKNDLENAKEVAEKYKNAYLEIQGKFKETLDMSDALRDAAQKDSGKIEALEESLRQHKRDMNELATECESLKRELSRSKDNFTKVEGDKKKAESELSQSRTRLSRLMGNKLSDNNPDIADLSDKNRPTKLAEKYTELYDNEWTDAFEALDKDYHDDKRTTETLLQILWDIKDQCDKIAKDQNQRLREAVALKFISDSSLPEDILKQIKDFRRFIVETSLPEVIVQCSKGLKYKAYASLMKDENVETFFKSCVELCWLMSVQDPPLAFGETPHKMDVFDADTYKHYTATGPYVAYLVWPALRLEVAGPLLCKGVAQACGRQPQKSFEQKNTESPTDSDTVTPRSSRRAQRAPPGQVIDRLSSGTGNFASHQNQDYNNATSNLYGTGQSAPVQNYDQLVVSSNPNRTDMSKTIGHASNDGHRTSVAARMNKNLYSSQRERFDRNIRMPSEYLWRKFTSLSTEHGINSLYVKQALGEDYITCLNYYNFMYGEQADTTV